MCAEGAGHQAPKHHYRFDEKLANTHTGAAAGRRLLQLSCEMTHDVIRIATAAVAGF